jgi:hypothetical protein
MTADRTRFAGGSGDGVRRWTAGITSLGVILAFLVSRLPNLDADAPGWVLTQYSPIDEFGYTVPAFDLNHYGTWVHQAAPWAPVEGLPMNVAQNVVAAVSMRLVGYDYWGLRASSILFGLIAFVALVAIVRRQSLDAKRLDGVPALVALAVTVAAAVLLLVDFSSLVSARIIEPTVTRLAAGSLIVLLVSRGTFLGDRSGLRRSGAFGAVVAAGVMFVYIYNLFLLPAAFVALAWWAFRSGGWPSVRRHLVAFLVGSVVVAIAYFGLVYVVYGETPMEWYRVWIGSFGTGARVSGASLGKVLSILDANIFRLDPAFLGLFLVSLPVFVWSMARRPTGLAVLIGLGLVFFVAQSVFVADYPARKFLMMMLFALPVVASGLLGSTGFRRWLGADRRRVIAAGAWLAAALVITGLESSMRPVPPHGATLVRIVAAGGIVGIAAIVIVAIAVVSTSSRRMVGMAGMVLMSLAVLAPLLYADAAFVYRRPTFTYRDAMIEVRPVVDGRSTAGGWSFAMQLYNTSRPVLNGYFFGISRSDYERDVVRMFVEGGATSMFDYVDSKTRSQWESLGFRLVDTYAIILPRGQRLGRYVLGSATVLSRISVDRGLHSGYGAPVIGRAGGGDIVATDDGRIRR